MKKKISIALAIVLFLALAYFWGRSTSKDVAASPEFCALCISELGPNQVFYEDDLTLAIVDHKPLTDGHCLVIPRKHYVRFDDLDDNTILALAHTIKKVNRAVSEVYGTDAYILLQKNGHEAGQSVPHVHFHYIPRKPGATPGLGFLLKTYVRQFQSVLSDEEMTEAVTKLSEAI